MQNGAIHAGGFMTARYRQSYKASGRQWSRDLVKPRPNADYILCTYLHFPGRVFDTLGANRQCQSISDVLSVWVQGVQKLHCLFVPDRMLVSAWPQNKVRVLTWWKRYHAFCLVSTVFFNSLILLSHSKTTILIRFFAIARWPVVRYLHL